MRMVIVHSPLVGPSTVRPLADALTAADVTVSVPDLRSAVVSPRTFRRAAAVAADGADVVIGHSGAGAFLPAIADGANDARCVYVDAALPAGHGRLATSSRFVALLDSMSSADGWLPPWNEWWPPDVMAELVPDPDQRRHVVAEIPRLRRTFYEDVVVPPTRWWTRRAAYLQLSAAYAEERHRAVGWGWPTTCRPGHHLDVCTDPTGVADAVRDLLARVTEAPDRPQ